MKETIVVVGYGWVGQANALALKIMGYDVSFFDVGDPQRKYDIEYHDVYKKIPRVKELLEKDNESVWYIVCVGDKVSSEGHQDITFIKNALQSLSSAKGGVILRSTVLPEYLNNLKFDYYVPEFLHEQKAVAECLNPHYFIVGQNSDRSEPSFFADWKSRAVKCFQGVPSEASFIKYLSNIWNSVRIAFVNEFGNVMHTPSSPENLASIERVINFFFEQKSYLRYGRSFGGHCLPKDTRAFFNYYKNKGKDVSLIEGAYKSNDAHMEVEKQYPILPEWFSEWKRPEMSGRVALRALRSAVIRNIKKIFN